jgi:nucleoside-diphosphate-sugar epimerase
LAKKVSDDVARDKKGGGGKKVFINGAGGFVGRFVVEEAVAAGYEVVANDLPGKDLAYAEALGAEVRLGDLTSYSFVEEAIKGCDYIINVAGLFVMNLPYETLYSANVLVSQNMSRAAVARGGVKRFVHIASMAVYGRPDATPLKEDYPLHPRNNYEKTKGMGEAAVLDAYRKQGLPVCTLRPGAVYGPWSRYGVAGVMSIMLVLASTPLRFIPMPIRDIYFHIVHVQDLARASVFLLDAEGVEGKVFNCGEDNPKTLEQQTNAFLKLYDRRIPAFKWHPLLGRVFRAMALLPDWVYSPIKLAIAWKWSSYAKKQDLTPGFVPRLDASSLDYFTDQSIMDMSRLRDAGFVFNYPDSEKGLPETVQWYIDNRWLPRHI